MMAAPKGHPRYGGRAKGTPNKRTEIVLEKLKNLNFCPIEKQVHVYNVALEMFDADRSDFKFKYLEIAQGAAKDLAQYTFPKLKAIEHTGESEFAPAVVITREVLEAAIKSDPMLGEGSKDGTRDAGAREIEALLESPGIIKASSGT